ncbi:mitochondrial inner membrane translocase subunit TIM44 [Histoplasma capsulatum G186AR]|uniref:Mitochondrial import inner membrane translocase subunit TIM44 n=2 Tax=Ajellomyces capsulatus TaxID=5037 RepID=C0NJG7_AJECG|nr:mitochondrial inner membrane translocase subunit TIM44 [Histoplasma capsulatum G186AR]EEH08008.1 mitochondrial inner membrane translocase subunit TIM44 [Histoplasma capsulatum G186AR]KAG5299670.1 mitochondrial inner membrane translocase subunit TIM44 [Histoplasma capsulatum]QSS67704.1 mitochondrial inner membrane translocase subunit TIM44 [Histoplasma capsulatum G186AR]
MLIAAKCTPPGVMRTALLRNHTITFPTAFASRAVSRRPLTHQTSLNPTISFQSLLNSASRHSISNTSPLFPATPTQLNSIWANLPARRSFQTGCSLWQQQQKRPEQASAENPKLDESSEKAKNEREAQNPNSQEEGKKAKDEPPPPPPPHGDKTPWQVFTETLRSEFKASKEWNESTKALASSAHQFTESESVKRARAAYEAASGAATSKTSSAIKTTGKVIGQGAAWTWDTSVVKGLRSGVSATGKGIEKATRPVRETAAYKTAVGGVKEAIDDGSSSRYGGWMEKEERRKQRELRELAEAKSGRRTIEKMVEDPNAGTHVTLHKDAAWKESWKEFRDSSRLMQSYFNLKHTYNESDNPLVTTFRGISDRVAGWFAENETAMVIKKFREMDPSFQIEPFLRELREYMLPEVLDAYVKGDVETLKLWLSEAQYNVYAALAQQYTTAGLKSDGRILDIRHVDISHARMLEPGDIPVFIITCRTQEVHVYRNVKTKELAAGMEDKVQLVTYAIGMTRIPEDVNNPETRGWRMIELQKSGRDYI